MINACFAILTPLICALNMNIQPSRIPLKPVLSSFPDSYHQEIKDKPSQYLIYKGIASFYSIDGCIGCSKNRTMANGEPLDDSKLTIAFNNIELNKEVLVRNLKNDKEILVKVTDRGGFDELGRIADLSLASKNALACEDLCNVEIEIKK